MSVVRNICSSCWLEFYSTPLVSSFPATICPDVMWYCPRPYLMQIAICFHSGTVLVLHDTPTSAQTLSSSCSDAGLPWAIPTIPCKNQQFKKTRHFTWWKEVKILLPVCAVYWRPNIEIFKQFKSAAQSCPDDITHIIISSFDSSCPFRICFLRLCEQYSVVLK
jgi:hypothetical protein